MKEKVSVCVDDKRVRVAFLLAAAAEVLELARVDVPERVLGLLLAFAV
jgi:hypothetical protein